jgi:methylmalonyl-CoA mutase N-terminal domain/subunit
MRFRACQFASRPGEPLPLDGRISANPARYTGRNWPNVVGMVASQEPSNREQWEEAFGASKLTPGTHATMSGIPLEPVYGPDDGEFPGQYPYTRGPYASMYRSKLWTMRMFAGFGTAEDTNWRFKEIINSGGTGLSTAFDMPTLLGLDSDHEMSIGEVGRCGVAIDTLADMSDLYAGIDLGQITTSMTINSPAAVIFAMFIAQAEQAGIPRAQLGGTLQNDILKEYQAQKEYVFPPRQSMRLVRDTIDFTAAEMPRWHSISISGYHIREAGSTAAEELAFTLANGFAYVELAMQAGLDVDAFAPRLSFFFNAHIDFFEEIAKYRAARRIWARWMKERYGAENERSMQLRFHTQTAGVSLTAQQPEVNIVRTAIEALAGVLGGSQSLHTNSMDEAMALPTEKAARIALRTQQVIAHETNVASVADPLGGSYFVESLTDEMERQAEELFAYLDELGDGSMLEGAIQGIEENWFQGRIADSAYELERRLNAGDHIRVGVNAFREGNDDAQIDLLRISNEDETKQRKRLSQVRQDRDQATVDASLERVRADAADPEVNLMPALIDAVKSYATLGEVMGTMEAEFGRHVEVPVI